MALRPGQWAKLCFVPPEGWAERMWVKITEAEGGRYWGLLDNAPNPDNFKIRAGDPVAFEAKHVFSVAGGQETDS